MRRIVMLLAAVAVMATMMVVSALSVALADTTAQTLPFSQDWSNTGLITMNDDWSGVPGIIGYRGDALTTSLGTDPQTITVDGSTTPLDVIANKTNPDTSGDGGVAEFEITDPTIALQGSSTAAAPHIVINLDTTGRTNINVAYNLRDIDGSSDNAVQPVALQYRVGSTDDYTNIPAGFVVDATTGPSVATLVTPVNAALPSEADNQPLVQVRIITTNAAGIDEWVGVDNISITGTTPNSPPTADNDSYKGKEDKTLNVSAPGVLSGDNDPESAPLTAIKVSNPSNGKLTLNTNGSFTYKPKKNFNGTDSFTYKACETANPTVCSAPATVTIKVKAVPG